MPSTRPARMLVLTLLIAGCGRRGADTHAPEPEPAVAPEPDAAPVPAGAEAAAEGAEEAAPAGAAVAPTQTVSFADDADPEPTTQVQAAPKRPPIPRFRLFGTRENDGPN